MVDVSAKEATARMATAAATVELGPVAFSALAHGSNAKGNVLAIARIAGIMAAKRTSDLIPLCHPLSLSHVAVQMTEVRAQMLRLSLAFVASQSCMYSPGTAIASLTSTAARTTLSAGP